MKFLIFVNSRIFVSTFHFPFRLVLVGYVLVQRASDNNVESNEITGCVLLIPPYLSFGRRTIQWMRIMIPMGIPPVPMKYNKLLSARFNAFVETTEYIQQQQMKTCLHWYIVNVSVNKKLSSSTSPNAYQSLALIKAVQDIVIHQGSKLLYNKLPTNKIYTECNDITAKVFQKVGFQLLQRYPLKNSSIPNDEEPYYYNGLCWTAVNSNEVGNTNVPVTSTNDDKKSN